MRKERTRTLHAGSLPSRIQAYLLANQDEELTISDAMAKFDASYNAVHAAVSRLGWYGIEYAKVVRLKAKGIAS